MATSSFSSNLGCKVCDRVDHKSWQLVGRGIAAAFQEAADEDDDVDFVSRRLQQDAVPSRERVNPVSWQLVGRGLEGVFREALEEAAPAASVDPACWQLVGKRVASAFMDASDDDMSLATDLPGDNASHDVASESSIEV